MNAGMRWLYREYARLKEEAKVPALEKIVVDMKQVGRCYVFDTYWTCRTADVSGF